MIIDAISAGDESYSLGEGPVWDRPRQRLLWVDILGRAVHEGRLDGTRIERTHTLLFDHLVGAVTVTVDGTLLVAGQEELLVIDSDSNRWPGLRVLPAEGGRRLNDGSTDPAGRFLVGSLPLVGSSEQETLVRLEHDGSLTTLDTDLRLSNGLAWSVDGHTLYNVDTRQSTVFARPYDPDTGQVGERRVHLRIDDGHPDGMATDAEDHLWIAIWGAGEVRRYAPDGTVVTTVRVPAPHTTCPAFAGDDLRTLVITTASGEMSEEERADHPRSGQLFTVRTEVPGLPVAPWSGPPPPPPEPPED